MEPIASGSRCRDIMVGWNLESVRYRFTYDEGVRRSFKWLVFIVIFCLFVAAFPVATGIVLSELAPADPHSRIAEATFVPIIDPAVNAIERLLTRYAVDAHHRVRVAEAIVQNGRRYDVDPKLIASIVVVESHANPFAISESASVGVMQIHLPTWGTTAEQENVNLFKIEDNIALGVRILKGYIERYGLWEGVGRYKGWSTQDPQSEQKADEYVQKVKRIYQPKASVSETADTQ